MINFEHARVYNFMGAIRNMRNSWQSWDKMDSTENVDTHYYSDAELEKAANVECFHLGEADKALALKLIKAGSDHAKFMRQILVSVDIIAGNELWKEIDTYKVGTVANSTSMMHTAGKRLLTEDDLSFDKPYSEAALKTLEHCNYLIQRWWDSGKKQGSPEWRDMQKGISMGFVYKRGLTCNYQVLQNMYFSRKNHRLKEWREFCDWVETLPYSELITKKF